MVPQHELSSSASYQPAAGPPGSGQPFTYAVDSPDLAQPPSAAASYYTKYSSVKQTSTTSTNNSAVSSSRGGQLPDRSAVPFPHQQARSPTPQSPPKRVEELMSEFRDFDSAHGGGGSPTPPMFTHARAPANTTNTVVVTELPMRWTRRRPSRQTARGSNIQRPRRGCAMTPRLPAASPRRPVEPKGRTYTILPARILGRQLRPSRDQLGTAAACHLKSSPAEGGPRE